MAKGMYIGVDGKARKCKKAYIGIDGIARKIKKMYIGIANVARLIFSSGVEYKGTVDAVRGRLYPASTSVGNYALFGGNRLSNSVTTETIDTINSSLTVGTATSFYAKLDNLSAASNSNYAIFGQASNKNGGYAFNSSLTLSRASTGDYYNQGTISSPNYAFFIGGYSNGEYYNYTRYIDNSKTSRILSTPYYYYVALMAGTTVGENYVYGGGELYDSYDGGTLDADEWFGLSSSLTSVMHRTLTYERFDYIQNRICAGTVGNNAIFAGGRASNITKLDVINASFTQSVLQFVNQRGIKCAPVENGLIFVGGCNYDFTTYNTSAYLLDESLTCSPMQVSSTRLEHSATSIGNRIAIFGYGRTGSGTNLVNFEVYE